LFPLSSHSLSLFLSLFSSSLFFRFQLNRLLASNEEVKGTQEGTFAQAKALGAKLAEEKFEHQKDVAARESELSELFASLSSLAAVKEEVLRDSLKREEYREKTELENEGHVASFKTVQSWQSTNEPYLAKVEKIETVRDAKVALDAILLFSKDMQGSALFSVLFCFVLAFTVAVLFCLLLCSAF
jgi:hypothetical protein